jgi:hypothetical protein
MKATVKKEDLQKAQIVKRLSDSPKAVVLLVRNGNLSVIACSHRYARYTVPADNCTDGMAALSTAMFDSLSYLRGREIKFLQEDSALKVNAGTKLKLYCEELPDGVLSPPNLENPTRIKLEKDEVKGLKAVLGNVFFFPVDDEVASYVLNSSKGVEFVISDHSQFVFYRAKQSMSDKNFSFSSYLSHIKEIFSLIEGRMIIDIAKDSMLIKSRDVVSSVPFLEFDSSHLDSAKEALGDDQYMDGVLEFDCKHILEVIMSIGIVCEGKDFLTMKVEGEGLSLGLKSSWGVSRDKIPCSNSMGDMTIGLSHMLFENMLHCCKFGKTIEMRISAEQNFFRLSTKDKNLAVKCIAPVSSFELVG